EFFSLGTFGGDGTPGSGIHLAFTNSALFMLLTVGAIGLFLIMSTNARAIVPGRAQLLSEMMYEFIHGMVKTTAGHEAMKFFPLVFSLFMFILVANLFGMFPYFFTVTSHLIVTVAMALIVFFTVVIYGFMRNGPKFLRLFVPSGVPIYILPLVTIIEVISFLSRPISHSLRLFGNILAGHIVLKVFGAGVGVGVIFGNYLAGALRNPAAAASQFSNLIFGFAVTEALGIFSLVIAFLLLYAV